MLIQGRISKTYGSVVVLDGFEIEVADDEIVAVVGESGSGKSTLVQILVGALPPDPGSPMHTQAGLNLAYASQQPELADWRTAEENVSLERELTKGETAPDLEAVLALLQMVGLSDVRDRLPNQLSVGMRQRLQLCRALYTQAALTILDEPLAAVDELSREVIVGAVRSRLKADGRSAIWVTHDIREAILVADRVLVVAGPPIRHAQEILVPESDRAESIVSAQGAEAQVRAALRDAERPRPTVAVKSSRTPSRSSFIVVVGPALFFGAILLAWHLLGLLSPGSTFYLSSPTAVGATAVREVSDLVFWAHVGRTAVEAGLGLVLALLSGVAIGLLASGGTWLSYSLRPFLIGATAVPLFVLAPAFIIWFGVGISMKVALAALSAAPIVALGLLDPFDVESSEFSRHLLRRGVSRRRVFARFVLPKGIVAFLQVLRPAAVAALVGAFLGEFISADQGLGYYILLNASRYHMEEVLTGSLVFFVLALVAQAASSLVVYRRLQIVRALGL